MSEKELSRRYTTERDENTAIQRRLDEYSMSKIDLAIEMIRRAIKHKIHLTLDSHELTISERIWQAILEFVTAITMVFSIDDEEVLDALVNESDELAHICELYQCKMAS